MAEAVLREQSRELIRWTSAMAIANNGDGKAIKEYLERLETATKKIDKETHTNDARRLIRDFQMGMTHVGSKFPTKALE